jgi:hypothetical protein
MEAQAQQAKLKTARELIDSALGSLHVLPKSGTIDPACVDVAVGKLTRARDEVVNAMPDTE